MTNDNKFSSYVVLCELCRILLDEYGIETRKEPNEKATVADKKPLAAGFAAKLSGMYYSCMSSYRISFHNDLLKIQIRQPDGWKDIITDAFFDGRRFVSGNKKFIFEESQNSFYLIEEETTIWGKNLWGQKCSPFPPISEVWKKRVGKKYIVCDAHPADNLLASGGFTVTIKEFENEEGLLFFVYKGPFSTNSLPVTTAGDYETEMVLNTPLMGSRENFAPFIYEKDGAQYLFVFGYNLIDTASIKPLQTGQVISECARQNKVFSITAGSKIKMDIPSDVRIIIFDSELKQKYDSALGEEINETCNGYILFINENPLNVSVEVFP